MIKLLGGIIWDVVRYLTTVTGRWLGGLVVILLVPFGIIATDRMGWVGVVILAVIGGLVYLEWATDIPMMKRVEAPFRSPKWLGIPAVLMVGVLYGWVSFGVMLGATILMTGMRAWWVMRHPQVAPSTVPIEIADEVDPAEVDYELINAYVARWPQVAMAVGLATREDIQPELLTRRQAARLEDDPMARREARIQKMTTAAPDKHEWIAPPVESVLVTTMGPRLNVRMHEGQKVDGYLKEIAAIADVYGIGSCRVARVTPGVVGVQLMVSDPLTEPLQLIHPELGETQIERHAVTLPAFGAITALSDIPMGRTEHGKMIMLNLAGSSHIIFQGQTRSGKSVATYGLLMHAAAMPDVLVAGCDPTGILLAPFHDSRHAGWQALTTRDIDSHVDVLDRVVDEMDRRNASLAPRYIDKLSSFTPEEPLILVVLEEYPGLLNKAADTKQDKAISMRVSRLLAEGAKAGIRVLMLVQRADASIVGGAARSNISTRLTLRVDNSDAVRMLHEGLSDPSSAEEMRKSPPGVGLYESAGPCYKLRTPFTMDSRYLDSKGDLDQYKPFALTIEARMQEGASADNDGNGNGTPLSEPEVQPVQPTYVPPAGAPEPAPRTPEPEPRTTAEIQPPLFPPGTEEAALAVVEQIEHSGGLVEDPYALPTPVLIRTVMLLGVVLRAGAYRGMGEQQQHELEEWRRAINQILDQREAAPEPQDGDWDAALAKLSKQVGPATDSRTSAPVGRTPDAAVTESSAEGSGDNPLSITTEGLYEAGEIGTRTYNRLAGLTLGDLVERTEADLLNIPSFGTKSLAEVKKALKVRGLRLAR